MTFLKSELQEAINELDSDLIVVGCGKWDRKKSIVVASTGIGTYESSYFLYNKKKKVLSEINPFKHMIKFTYANHNIVKLI